MFEIFVVGSSYEISISENCFKDFQGVFAILCWMFKKTTDLESENPIDSKVSESILWRLSLLAGPDPGVPSFKRSRDFQTHFSGGI